MSGVKMSTSAASASLSRDLEEHQRRIRSLRQYLENSLYGEIKPVPAPRSRDFKLSYVPYGYYEDRYRSSSQAAQLCDAQSKVAHLKAQVAVRDAIIDELSEQCDRLYVHERDWKLAVAAATEATKEAAYEINRQRQELRAARNALYATYELLHTSKKPAAPRQPLRWR